MGRVESREELFKLVFEYCMSKEENEFSLNEALSSPTVDGEYVSACYHGIIEKYDEIVAQIDQVSKGYNKDRIYKVDLALLVMAIYEIKYVSEIPPKVSINEVLNLSKKYSTEKSAGFINGILANFTK